jgi:Fe-S oxidoreductase
MSPANPKKEVYIFVDEFTQYNDVEIGMATIVLLYKLGYKVRYIPHPESGRAYLSKGLLDDAKKLANGNVRLFSSFINEEVPLIGIEPSAILSFRDEYPKLVDASLKEDAKKMAKNSFMIDEFIAKEWELGNIDIALFKEESRKIYLHGHCHQKALSKVDYSAWMLSIPPNYEVEMIPSGCCGMAGSFGYEEEHYEVSMKVGELVLFPAVRKAEGQSIIAAPGTSCRHQIKDGTGKHSMHPVEILLEAMK